MKNLLVPIDGSSYSMQAVDKAKEIALAFKSNVVLVTVSEQKSVDYPSSPYKFSQEQQAKATVSLIEQKKKAQAVLDSAKTCLTGLPGRVDTVILEGNPAEMILEYANGHNIDLIVMGSKGMSGLQNLFIGSVTRRVALKTTRPILIVR